MSERRGWRCVGDGVYQLALRVTTYQQGAVWAYADRGGAAPTLAEAQEAAEKAAGIGQDEALRQERDRLAAELAEMRKESKSLNAKIELMQEVANMNARELRERDGNRRERFVLALLAQGYGPSVVIAAAEDLIAALDARKP